MKPKVLRVIVPLAVVAIVAIGFATHGGIGTLSAIGWQDISLLCPLGALTSMLAEKLVVPQAVISIIIAVILILLLGRAFCGWICPIPVVSKLREVFARGGGKKARVEKKEKDARVLECHQKSLGCGDVCASCAPVVTGKSVQDGNNFDCDEPQNSACSPKQRGRGVDSRHFVLGGALLSATIFGFPVFCLVCPIGLTFATVLLVMRLFGAGDVTIGVIIVPLLLIAEVVLFRKWCHRLCPLSAIMSLVAKGNKTFQPKIDNGQCLESTRDVACGKCAMACPEGIDPRIPQSGTAAMNECTRCMACIEACPTKAIKLPLSADRSKGNNDISK